MLKFGPNPGSLTEDFVAWSPVRSVEGLHGVTRTYGSFATALIAAPDVESTVVATAGGRTGTVVSGAILPRRVRTASTARSPATATSHAVCGVRLLIPRVSILTLMVPSFSPGCASRSSEGTVGSWAARRGAGRHGSVVMRGTGWDAGYSRSRERLHRADRASVRAHRLRQGVPLTSRPSARRRRSWSGRLPTRPS